MAAKYIRLANILKEKLSANPGTGTYRLPSENSLSMQYGVSRQTVRQALSILEAEGLIEKRKGSGSWATGLSADPKKNQIAVMLTSANEYIYPALLADIQGILKKKGYEVRVCITENSISRERNILKELLENPVRGLIVEGCCTALPNPNLDLYESLKRRQVCILFLHNYYGALKGNICLQDDNYAGGYFLGKHLIMRHHTQIAGIFKIDDIQGHERASGWFSSMRDYSLPLPDTHTAWYTSRELKLLRKKQDTGFLRDFIRNELTSCSAVICHNDEIAYWLIRELKRANLRVPQDISVVSFGNTYYSEISSVRLTSLSHKPHETGIQAAQTLLKMIQGIPVHSQILPWSLTVRDSDCSFSGR